MDFRIADSFTDSLTSLTNDEQKAVKTTAFDLQLDPSAPGMQFHKLGKAKDPNFWSVRVNNDIRLIVHRTGSSLLLCYAGHHDDAYAWAERRKIDQHPVTGAMQLIEIREKVREIVVPPRYVSAEEEAPSSGLRPPSPRAAGRRVSTTESVATSGLAVPRAAAKPLFPDTPDWVFLSYGVPEEWLADVRVATEETLFDLAEHLPQEAAEALLDLAVGVKRPVGPGISVREDTIADRGLAESEAFAHPDAQRRFRIIENREELERALESPWEKWTVFLHPAQRQLVERRYSGAARISGSAGTGKTIVALHRAVHLARAHPDARVLLATFSEPLANALRLRIRQLIGNEPRIAERLEVHAMASIGRRLYEAQFGKVRLASQKEIQDALREAAGDSKFTPYFLWSEWTNVVDAWQLARWEDYRDVKRLGRKTRLPEKQRQELWTIFEKVRERFSGTGEAPVPHKSGSSPAITEAAMFTRLAARVATLRRPIFDHAVIDEAQDVSIAELRFLAALGGGRPDALFFTGDLGQRIFQQPFSWSSLGVDIRGRSSRLRVNYRTSHQIRRHADRLLGETVVDVDGVTEERGGTISVFEGVAPDIAIESDESAEERRVTAWLQQRIADGLLPHEIAIFVRSAAQIGRARAAIEAASIPFVILDEGVETKYGHASIATMHLAKGLEFRAVAVMACDDEVIPLQERIESVTDEADLDDVYATERHLLYVACTRARDHLLVSGVAPGSEFVADLPGGTQ